MGDSIKPSQFMFLNASFIMGSTLLITMVDSIAGQSTWMVMIAAFIVAVPFLLVYIALTKRFPGKSLIEMNDIVFGRVIGKVVSVFYLLAFLLLLSFNTADVSGFYNGYIMPETPAAVIVIPMLLVCAFTVKRGIASLARFSVVMLAFTGIAVFVLALLLIGDMDFSNFLPVLDKPAIRYVQATQTVTELPYLEVVSMLMVVPMLRDTNKLGRKWFYGMGIAMVLFVAISVRNTAVLGGATQILGDNSYEAIRLIDIGEFLTRIELVIALNYTASLFIKICVLYYATVVALSQLLRVDKNTMILPIGALTLVLAAIKVESTVEHTLWGAKYAAVFSFPYTIVLPLLTLIIAAIRKLRLASPPQMVQPPKQRPKRRAECAPAEGAK